MAFIIIYLICVSFGMCVAYGAVIFLLTHFFGKPMHMFVKENVRSLFYIAGASLVINTISFLIKDPDFSNRILHMMGGGFMGFFVCVRAVKDSTLSISRFQFLTLSMLLVTAMGVGNEILEFFLQNYFYLISSQNPFDTWLDLISNTLGIITGALVFTPFLNLKRKN